MTIEQAIAAVLIGIWHAESSNGTDKAAFEAGRHAAGHLQITEICFKNYAKRVTRCPYRWPETFLNVDRATIDQASLNVYQGELTHFAHAYRDKYGRDPYPRELALIWRYGFEGAEKNRWTDPEGYWDRVVEGME